MLEQARIKQFVANRVTISFGLVVLLFVIGGIISSGFFTVSHLMNILGLSSFLGIIALGQTIVILSGMEGLDLSVGAVVSLGAVMSAKIMETSNGNVVPAIAAVLLTGFIVGTINGIGVAYFRVPALIMTLAMSSVVAGFALVYTNGQPTGGAAPAIVSIGSGRLGAVSLMFVVWVVIVILAELALRKLRWGHKLYGTGANNLTAGLSGVRTRLLRMFAYSLSGVISALAGVFVLGYTQLPYLDIGSVYVLPSIAAVVIGGVSLAGGEGRYLGVVAGAIVLTTLNSILVTLRMGEGGRQIVYGVVILLVLYMYSLRRKR